MMHKKIQELEEEATHTSWNNFKNLDINKFAELIIKECARVCEADYWTPDGLGITKADQRCADAIKKHFGVE